jgi:phosphatidylglycerol:prolipoprotein diacylglycerol transferase
MHPVLATFSIAGQEVALRAYGTLYVLAWVSALALGTLVARKRGISWWRALLTFAAALGVGVVGARLLDIALYWDLYASGRVEAFGLEFRGFSLYGGLILALVTAVVLASTFHLPLWRLADSAVPALVAGIVLMRVGCFLNGCCFGNTTSLPWGVTFPLGSPAWAQQVATGESGLLGFTGLVLPVHPTQLYEMGAALAFGGLALWMMCSRDPHGRPRFPDGLPFLVFALGFTLFRLGNTFLRAVLPQATAPRWFYPLLYVAIAAVIGAVMAWRVHSQGPAKERRP